MIRFTNREKAECAERESKMRDRVYPRRVGTGRMTAEAAERETALMREIAAECRARAAQDEPRMI